MQYFASYLVLQSSHWGRELVALLILSSRCHVDVIRFPSNIDFSKCRREIAASLNDFSNRWCKRENIEPDALKEWKINIF